MTDEEHSEIIALCEDPNEDFSDVQGRSPTREEATMVAQIADGLFFQCSADEQVDDILYLPTHLSARLLAQMPTAEAVHILSCLPSHLSEEIRSLMPVVAI